MYGVIGYMAIRIAEWLSKDGINWAKGMLGLVSDRDKNIAATAKEGPIMVLERVERELRETKENYTKTVQELRSSNDQILSELKTVRQQHFDCETKHAAIVVEVQYLKQQVEELRAERE